MKLIVQKLGVASLTFVIGLFSVFTVKKISNAENTALIDELDLENAVIVTIAPKPPRFIETYQGCALDGVIQGYETNDGIALFAGNAGCRKPKNHDKKIVQKDSKRIISKTNRTEKTFYEIYQIENSYCIDAPTIELGLELDKWLESQK